MLYTILWTSGIVLWVGLVLWLIPKFLGAIPKTITYSSTLFPITRFIRGRYFGILHSIKAKLGMQAFPKEMRQALHQVKYSHMTALRDAYQELDKLPTLQRGFKDIGIKSILELEYRKEYPGIKSPYTHPMQAPMFYLPGIPAVPFLDDYRDKPGFEWARPLEEAFPVILEELKGVLAGDGKGFQNYMAENVQLIQGWNTFNFFFFGKKYEENCAQCPKTTALLESFANFEKDHIMFSCLNPHSHIPPHVGPMNGILRVHLPLIVPDGCYLHVGPEIRKVEAGKLMVFDDAFVHEAWNHSDELRIVLFLNFWHPDFSGEEIASLENFRRAYELHPLAQLHAKNQEVQRDHTIAAKG